MNKVCRKWGSVGAIYSMPMCLLAKHWEAAPELASYRWNKTWTSTSNISQNSHVWNNVSWNTINYHIRECESHNPRPSIILCWTSAEAVTLIRLGKLTLETKSKSKFTGCCFFLCKSRKLSNENYSTIKINKIFTGSRAFKFCFIIVIVSLFSIKYKFCE